MSAIISVSNLTKEYTTYRRGSTFRETVKSLFHREKVMVTAVKDISFQIQEGEIVGLLGKNGAGKSSTLKMLTGVLFPTSGEIKVMDYIPFSQRSQYVGHIGAVFGQKSQLIWDIPPIDSFYMNKAIYSIPNAVFQEQLNLMVELFELKDIMTKPTRVLSLGERMKCEFIMAMLHRPKVVFLDEPTIGLDILAKEKIRNFILEMNRNGVTFILTTHDIEDVERLANRVIIINHGEKVFENTLDALRKHLGNKKNVFVTMKNPIQKIQLDGLTVLQMHSPVEAELLIDLSVVSMNQFISYVSDLGEIADISIKELRIEEIIASIYNG